MIPLRTLEDVKDALTKAHKQGAAIALARLMLRHGRLTDEAREYVAREYPEIIGRAIMSAALSSQQGKSP